MVSQLLVEKYEKPTEVDHGGSKIWRNRFGEIHRDKDKPAIIYKDGWKKYYKNGKEYQPIKTFEDACVVFGINPHEVERHNYSSDTLAYEKLKIIVKALNQGWIPDWNNTNQRKWYPWFEIGSGFGFSGPGYYFSSTYANFGSRLCFKTEKLTTYAGKKFKKLYEEYLIYEQK